MSRKSSIQYNPKLTVKENAVLNNVSISGIYYYIRNHSINREDDRANNLIDKITHAIKNNPEASPFKISKITGLHLATVKKYWDYAESGEELKSEAMCSPYRKPSLKELECFFTTDKSAPSDLLRYEQFGKQILDPYCSTGVIADVMKASGYKVQASDIQDRGYGEIADFHKSDWELDKYDIVSVPPIVYNLFPTIMKCVEVAKSKVALLLPLDLIAGIERYNRLFDCYPPTKIYAYLEPISFYRNSVERIMSKKGYGWFIWNKKAEKGTTLTWIHNEQPITIAEPKDEESTTNEESIKGIIGAVIGDIVGSSHEFTEKVKNKDRFKLFGTANSFTDDTVMTVAVADALLKEKTFTQSLRDWGNTYPYAGYGRRFRKWLKNKPVATDSAGNGSAMRVSAVGFRAKSLEEALKLAKETATPSHNSKDAIKAAQCTAAAIFMANNGYTKTDIIEYIKKQFGYKIFDNEEDVVSFVTNPSNSKTELARVTMPVALSAFMQGDSFESVLRLAVYFGVDVDTTGAISSSISGAYFGIPRKIAEQAAYYLPKDILDVVNLFDGNNLPYNRITPKNIRRNGINTVIVYGANIDDSINAKGRYEARLHKKDRKGFPIRVVGTPIEILKEDVDKLIASVDENPEKLFYIFDVGINEPNRGVELMARLFEPLKDKDNVYLWKDFWDYYNSYEK